MIPLIIIEGATASGKTALAIELAQMLETEIISADSRQVYKYLDIGTAKPTPEELAQVKHHLLDIIKPDESFNAGLFRKKAVTIIKKLHKQGRVPIICGGTGLYIKVLLEGLFESDIDDKDIRNKLEQQYQEQGLESLYHKLCEVDKDSAERISAKDKQRILRALEVFYATGIPISEHWSQQQRKEEFKPFRILLDEERSVLYQRIDTRILKMLSSGLIDEIKSILSKGYNWVDAGFNSVGYKEFKPFIENCAELASCTALAQQHTRNYAKRQITWYKKCNFHLSEQGKSINLDNVTKNFRRFIDKDLFRG